MDKLFILFLFVVSLYGDSSYYERGRLVNLQELNTPRDYDSEAVKYFKTTTGQKIAITDEILVKCKDGIDCKKLLNSFSLTDISNLTDTIYIVKVIDYDSIFPISKELFESGDVEFAHPNFIKQKRKR